VSSLYGAYRRKPHKGAYGKWWASLYSESVFGFEGAEIVKKGFAHLGGVDAGDVAVVLTLHDAPEVDEARLLNCLYRLDRFKVLERLLENTLKALLAYAFRCRICPAQLRYLNAGLAGAKHSAAALAM
jgi:hypothetical protein